MREPIIEILENLPSLMTLLMLGLPLAYVLGIPLLILGTFRMEAFPTMEEVGPDVKLPEIVRHQFSAAHEELSRLGFTNEGTYFLPEAVTNVKTILAYFINHSQRTTAMSVVMYAKPIETWVVQAQYTELCTVFSDDSEICTGNQNTAGSFPIPEESLNTIHPKIQQIDVLLQAHDAMVRAHGRGRRPIIKSHETFHDDIATYLSSGMTSEFEFAKECGYLRYSGGQHADFSEAMQSSPYRLQTELTKPVYVPTVKGAYLMAWKELWPFKRLYLAARFARDRKLLEQSGFVAPK